MPQIISLIIIIIETSGIPSFLPSCEKIKEERKKEERYVVKEERSGRKIRKKCVGEKMKERKEGRKEVKRCRKRDERKKANKKKNKIGKKKKKIYRKL